MNLLKSIFISCFTLWLALVSLYALTELARGMEPMFSWLGLALSALAPLSFFIEIFLFSMPRTPRHPMGLSILSGLGMVITLVMSYRYGDAAGMIHVWAGITFVAWFVYLQWYSVFTNRNSAALKVGSSLPVFQLENLQGHTVSSESFKAKPHILLFYRGNWCPFCTAQIKELANDYQRLKELGAAVVLISPQSIEKNQHLAAKYEVPLIFLKDRDSAAAKQLGILHPWGTPMGMQVLGYDSDSVLPTLIVTDKRGVIVYSDQTDNYRVRPEPSVFIDILKANTQ